MINKHDLTTVFSIHTSLQAGHYHVERRLTSVQLQFGWSLEIDHQWWVSLHLGINNMIIILFCDNNVSDQSVLQCKTSCAGYWVDYQALQFYRFNPK